MIVRILICGFYNDYNVCGCSEEAVTHLMAAHPVDSRITHSSSGSLVLMVEQREGNCPLNARARAFMKLNLFDCFSEMPFF